MNDEWKQLVVTRVVFAMHAFTLGGKPFHANRPSHGLILNDEIADKDYVFSDGRVLHTEGNELFYLPKGSTYQVKTYRGGDCYAINFDAALSDEPFTMRVRDVGGFRKQFQIAAKHWKSNAPMREMVAMRALYDIVLGVLTEREREYQPSSRARRVAPAMDAIKARFSEPSLTVEALASLCGMSDVYFRRLFQEQYGVFPKEYLIRTRIEYAKSLLSLGSFSVAEVAAMSGYSDLSHFSREFSRRVGVSPSQYTE